METILTTESIAHFQQSLSAKGRSGNTIRAYVADLNGLLHWTLSSGFEPSTFESLAQKYLNETRADSSPATTRRRIATFKTYAKQALKVTILEDYSAPTPAKARPHPLPEGMGIIHRMAENANTWGEKALVSLCGMLALRVSEARSIRPSDFNLSDPTRISLTVRGKGDKVRIIPVPDHAWEYLVGPYYTNKAYDTTLVNLSDSGARRAWKRIAVESGASRDSASHDGRATKATDMLQKTPNIRVVQEFLGHSSIKTTEIYTAVTEDEMRKAASL